MTSHTHSRQSNPFPPAHSAPPQHPQSILQRISSSLSSIRLAMKPRKLSTRHPPPTRPHTAPALSNRAPPNHLAAQAQAYAYAYTPSTRSSRAPSPPVIPLLSELNPHRPGPCPADLDPWLRSVEARCEVCGVRDVSGTTTTTTWTWTVSRPCNGCESGSGGSGRARRGGEGGSDGRRGGGRRRRFGVEGRSESRLVGVAVTTDEGALGCGGADEEVVARKVPERTATNVVDFNLLPPSPREPEYQLTRRTADSTSPLPHTPRSSAALDTDRTRPASPSLHHLSLLPKSLDYPYVHKHEVGPHIDALRAGSPSPLRQSPDEGHHALRSTRSRSRTTRHGRLRDEGAEVDYSETVYHGYAVTERAERARRLSGHKMRSSVLIIEKFNSEAGTRRSGNADRGGRVLEEVESDSHSLQPCARSEGRVVVQRADTQESQIVGGRRLELKGGSGGGALGLRGGGAAPEEQHESCGFSSCKWVLLGPCSGGNISRIARDDEALPPARLAHTRRERSCGTTRLPVGLTRDSDSKRAIDSRESATAQTTPVLRGGGAGSPSPSTLSSTIILPPTLFWLAGGKGRSISVAGWRKNRPRKRMDGLMGMVMFGRRAGVEYCGTDESAGLDVIVECATASVGGGLTSKEGSSGAGRRCSSAIQSLHGTDGNSGLDTETSATEGDEATGELLEGDAREHVGSGAEKNAE